MTTPVVSRPADAVPADTVPAARAPVEVARPAGDRSARTRRTIAYALLIGYAVLMLVPFAWSISTSFKTTSDAVRDLTLVPDPVSTQGWERAFSDLNPALPRMFLNSILIAAAVTATNLILGSMAGYAFARLRFRGREILFLLVLGTLMIPDQLRLVPVYQVLKGLGLLQDQRQYLGVVFVMGISAATIFLLRQYFLSIPRELEEAAKIDGAGFFTTFVRVILPLATPALAAVAILQFQGAWNGFFWPFIILQDRQNWTLPLGIAQFLELYNTQWPAVMAVVVMATVPIVVLYLFFQRYFVEGIAATGIKG